MPGSFLVNGGGMTCLGELWGAGKMSASVGNGLGASSSGKKISKLFERSCLRTFNSSGDRILLLVFSLAIPGSYRCVREGTS